MYKVDYESIRCDILYPEIERIVIKKEVSNPSFDHLKDLLKAVHYSFLCEADEEMYDEIYDKSSRRRSYSNSYDGGYYKNITNNPSIQGHNGSYYSSSGHNEKEKAVADLEKMMNEAHDPSVRRAIQETLEGMMR